VSAFQLVDESCHFGFLCAPVQRATGGAVLAQNVHTSAQFGLAFTARPPGAPAKTAEN
jgi:hypothetical protein